MEKSIEKQLEEVQIDSVDLEEDRIQIKSSSKGDVLLDELDGKEKELKEKRVKDCDNEHLKEFIKSENKDLLDIAKRSKFSIYCEPRNASEHIQNLIVIKMKVKQTKFNQEDFQKSLYEKYKDLKTENFPLREMKNLLKEAKDTLPKKEKQLDIKSFFKRKNLDDDKVEQERNKIGRQEAASTSTNIEYQKSEKSPLTSLGVTLRSSVPLAPLSESISDPIVTLCKKYDVSAQEFFQLDYGYEQNTSHTDSKSKIFRDRIEAKKSIKLTKETLEDYSRMITEVTAESGNASIFQKAEILANASKQAHKFNDQLCLNLQQGLETLKVVNKTLKKEERLTDGNNNGQLCIANATSGGARKAAWANKLHIAIEHNYSYCC